ncbi:1-(5-phosphoribosyl)-5-[(5-phosphoribosylamino)methylideneamino]imidazole-4-carboxamide isomerase [Blattabacterium cuenoti]|uniref:1-(5-phosphoribosyl)-5-[(5- phosphoribosylamino)methylideneamino]imidazole-4- carboxamide isomerase n=1 Tax=Blattabacterium cuenoti TaxID=1653831 RepID=UPI00163B927F|nr:1-(5-phosphoribosyl)-5-[(5-phosphoribosylamino)methylideneamino] imidazole-4-carboxamide isomerase [Blattabacterium cuenoti]
MKNNYINNIIIAIDIINGKCVRLTKGDFSKKKIYNNNPLDIALLLEDNGISRLHLVDLDGAKKGKVVHWKILENITKKTDLIVDFSGGINKENDVKIAFENGASMVSIGTIAVNYPMLLKKLISIYGNDKIILGADVKNYNIVTSGWIKYHDIHILNFLKEKIIHGIKNVFCTDISKDGSLSGPSFTLYEKILEKFPGIKLIASGGISNIKDIKKLIDMGCYGVIIGKSFYEKKISFSDIKKLN